MHSLRECVGRDVAKSRRDFAGHAPWVVENPFPSDWMIQHFNKVLDDQIGKWNVSGPLSSILLRKLDGRLSPGGDVALPIAPQLEVVEPTGIEPVTSSLPAKRSPS